jgi:hypothetical protein
MSRKLLFLAAILLSAFGVSALAQTPHDNPHVKKADEYIVAAEKALAAHDTEDVLKDLEMAKSEIEAFDKDVTDEKVHALDLKVEAHLDQIAAAVVSQDSEQFARTEGELEKVDEEVKGITLFLF